MKSTFNQEPGGTLKCGHCGNQQLVVAATATGTICFLKCCVCQNHVNNIPEFQQTAVQEEARTLQ